MAYDLARDHREIKATEPPGAIPDEHEGSIVLRTQPDAGYREGKIRLEHSRGQFSTTSSFN
jgi:hypothetical protein